MSACKRCTDLKRAWGWAKEDVRDAARKMSRRPSIEGAERIKERKAALTEASRVLNAHTAEHEDDAA